MRKERVIRVTQRPTLTGPMMLRTYVGAFGVLWLLFEPLPSLGLLPRLEPIPRWSLYLALLIAAGLVTYLTEILACIAVAGRMSFLRVRLVLTEVGTRHDVAVPLDMKVDQALEILFRRLARSAPKGTALSREEMYDKILLVRQSGSFEEVDGELTFEEAGIQPGALLKVRGIIRPQHTSVAFSSVATTPEYRAKVVQELKELDDAYNECARAAARLNKLKESQGCHYDYGPDPWRNPRMF